MNIVFLASPASGKGTHGKRISEEFGFKYVSVGQLLRDEVAQKSKVGLSISSILDTGNFVTDDIVNEIMFKRINEMKDVNYILDGYPRTVNQAAFYNNYLKSNRMDLPIVLVLEISYSKAMSRIRGRLICQLCKKEYNSSDIKFSPKVLNTCDVDGTTLVKRSDDDEEVFKNRYKLYENITLPVKKFYEELTNVYTIDSGDFESASVKLKQIVGDELNEH